MKKNIQRPTCRPVGRFNGCPLLDVGCRVFLSFTVLASSLSAQTSTKNMLPPLAPAYGELRPTFWEQHGTAVVILGFIAVVSAAVLGWLIFRPTPPVPVPPEVKAREALKKLGNLPEDGMVLSEISQTLRRYIIAAFQFPPGELTTTEFTAAFAGNQKVGGDLAQTISGFLRECDQRKFAPANPNSPLNAADRALEIVSRAEQQRTPVQIP
jgi:hypothetical protein